MTVHEKQEVSTSISSQLPHVPSLRSRVPIPFFYRVSPTGRVRWVFPVTNPTPLLCEV